MEANEEIQAWRRWRELCALDRLEPEERGRLVPVIAMRFRSRARQLSLCRRKRLDAPPDRDCAHLFESFCALHHRVDGKKYKHWLLERGRRDLDSIQSGVMLLVRNVVREWVRDACPETAELSLQETVLPGVRLEQLIPDPETRPLTPELEEWIYGGLSEWMEGLDPVEAEVLRVRHQGRVFSDPAVLAEVSVGKSTLHKYHRGLLFRLAGDLQRAFPELEPGLASDGVLRTLDELGKMIFLKKSAENPELSAFGRVEVHDERE